MGYSEDLETNKYKLDDELIKQPILYMQYQEDMITNQKERDNLKIEIDIKKSALKEVESNLFVQFKDEKINGKPPSDTFCNNLVIVHPKRKAAFLELIETQKSYNQAVYEFSILEAAVKSFEQRKKSLEKLVELYLSGYFSRVKQEQIKENTKKLKERLNKND